MSLSSEGHKTSEVYFRPSPKADPYCNMRPWAVYDNSHPHTHTHTQIQSNQTHQNKTHISQWMCDWNSSLDDEECGKRSTWMWTHHNWGHCHSPQDTHSGAYPVPQIYTSHRSDRAESHRGLKRDGIINVNQILMFMELNIHYSIFRLFALTWTYSSVTDNRVLPVNFVIPVMSQISVN